MQPANKRFHHFARITAQESFHKKFAELNIHSPYLLGFSSMLFLLPHSDSFSSNNFLRENAGPRIQETSAHWFQKLRLLYKLKKCTMSRYVMFIIMVLILKNTDFQKKLWYYKINDTKLTNFLEDPIFPNIWCPFDIISLNAFIVERPWF